MAYTETEKELISRAANFAEQAHLSVRQEHDILKKRQVIHERSARLRRRST
jgi:hypothetical protein